jgi:hypothetical protein
VITSTDFQRSVCRKRGASLFSANPGEGATRPEHRQLRPTQASPGCSRLSGPVYLLFQICVFNSHFSTHFNHELWKSHYIREQGQAPAIAIAACLSTPQACISESPNIIFHSTSPLSSARPNEYSGNQSDLKRCQSVTTISQLRLLTRGNHKPKTTCRIAC